VKEWAKYMMREELQMTFVCAKVINAKDQIL
jgi:hypothetical protein